MSTPQDVCPQTRTQPRVILWDIETSFNIVAKFSLREEWVPHQNILQERYIICAAWKELDKKAVQAVSVLDDPKRYATTPHDDYHVVRTLHAVLSQADVTVAHNGDSFDVKWLNGRILTHGLPPLPPITTIDTKTVAAKKFYLNSNRLDYLGRLLGVGTKIHTEPELWLEVLKGNQAAIRTMVRYNKGDVQLLERIFKKLQPFIPDHFNRQLHGHSGCPRCGSARVQSRGVYRTLTQMYRKFQCSECGGWFRQRKAEPGRAAIHRAV